MSMTEEQRALAAVEESIAELQETTDKAIAEAKDGLREMYGGISEKGDAELERLLAEYEPSVTEGLLVDYFGYEYGNYEEAMEPLIEAIGYEDVDSFYIQWSGLQRMTEERKRLLAGQMVMQLENELNVPKVVSLEQYLAERGLSSPISDYTLDKTRLPHGETERQRKKRLQEGERVAREYHDRRNAAIREYERLVKRGEIRKPTRIEEMQDIARGNPDNASVQAARRVLRKRGLGW